MNTKDPSYQEAFKEGLNKVVHDIPYSSELEAMSYADLSIALEHSKQGSARRSVIEREKIIRDNLLKINSVYYPARNPTAQVPGKSDKQKPNVLNIPIGYVWLTAIGTVLGVCIIYLVKTHLGIPL